MSDGDDEGNTGEGFVFIRRDGGKVFKTVYSVEEIERYLIEYDAVVAIPARDHASGQADGFR